MLKNHFKIIGYWKPGRKLDDFPITYMLSGSSQDVSQARAEIENMITKVYINKLIIRFFVDFILNN